MEDFQRKPGQRHEGKPRKVRFKLASSYSGRVLKHVYEDGQELESPQEKYPHSFIHAKLHQQLGVGFQDPGGEPGLYPTTGLIAQRINVYRDLGAHGTAVYEDLPEGDGTSPVLDFGKIIIYTSNLRIIRAPQRGGDSGRSARHSREGGQEPPRGRESRSRLRQSTPRDHKEEHDDAPKQEEVCEQCGGSGRAPCSQCHGSKLSMLANRFNESIRELRCPACNPHGQEPCHSCVQ